MNNSSSDTQKQHFTPITIDALEEALHWHSPFENNSLSESLSLYLCGF